MSDIVLFNGPRGAMRLRSGGFFDLEQPEPQRVILGDIACGLSRICRFGGQSRRFYSVAEHCVHAVRIARGRRYSIDPLRAVALHDAAEAYVGDMIRPLRHLICDFAGVERRVAAAIFCRFGVGLIWLHASSTREIDDGLLVREYSELLDDTVQPSPEFAGVKLECWEPELAEWQFLATCRELGIQD